MYICQHKFGINPVGLFRCAQHLEGGVFILLVLFYIYLFYQKLFKNISLSPTQNPIRKIIITAVISFSKRFPLIV